LGLGGFTFSFLRDYAVGKTKTPEMPTNWIALMAAGKVELNLFV
jgi:hypothetical protein